jgi:DNA modification methylase
MAGFSWKRVADPFSGTGATLLACEARERQCFAMELDPVTAAVALERWSDAGLSPQLSADSAPS